MIRGPRRVVGPLAPYAAGLRPALSASGYAPTTIHRQYGVFRQLSGWLAAEGLGTTELTEGVAVCFVQARWRAGYGAVISIAGLTPLLTYLRRVSPVPSAPAAATDHEVGTLAAYRRYLEQERGLAPLTVTSNVLIAGRFLTTRRLGGASEDLTKITVGEVHAFVLTEANRLSIGATRASLGATRSMLRYLFAIGTLSRDLSVTIPRIAGARLGTLPRGLDAATVGALLGSCDRHGNVGRRDFAIMTLQVRLGLRAHEVAAMLLEDIDWRAGELTVRGKGGRTEGLPLPADVGEALVDYLQHGRAVAGTRAVFLRAAAPPAPISRNAVVMVSRTASRRVGIEVVGTHRLRHTAATDMLQAGATLREVGQVLRHSGDATTAIYAKVDQGSLRRVARAWAEIAR